MRRVCKVRRAARDVEDGRGDGAVGEVRAAMRWIRRRGGWCWSKGPRAKITMIIMASHSGSDECLGLACMPNHER